MAHTLREEGAAVMVVVPYWPAADQYRFREMEALATEVVVMWSSVCSKLNNYGPKPHLSAFSNYYEDLGLPGPAKGGAVTRAVRGMATIKAAPAVQEENIETQQTSLLARHD
ncbi:hypothetical protein CYMTET_4959 [Cymbomonas tetramitiformis]|uniref:Uncharacterized protein n=1 Tax=Cymbomonas tetramitiformis TaxID=36881 RepID=A0AAE0LJK9_9CHLO|nr:hypothetical protein CYMTET_4959 [Cymbomonas tetramitiformis]